MPDSKRRDDAPSFISRVQGVLAALPEAERRLADFALDLPGDLASYSASEIAHLAGVSNATVTRFVRRLGYEDYNAARVSVRTERQSGSPLMLGSRAQAGSGAQAHLAHGIANLQNTFARLPEGELAAIVEAIVAAPRVWLAGFRASHAFAAYLRWQMAQFLPGCALLPGPGETIGEYMAAFGSGDCLILFALRRRTMQVSPLLDAATAAGARRIYVTDHLAPDPVAADWTLRCDARAPGPLDNHVAVMGLCDLIASAVLERLGRLARRRLAEVDAAHEAVGELAD